MNDLWFGIAMVALGAALGGSIGYIVYLLIKALFPIG